MPSRGSPSSRDRLGTIRAGCEAQPLPGGEDGCGKEVADWLALMAQPKTPRSDTPPPKPLTLDKLPADCRTVLDAKPVAKVSPATAASPAAAGDR